MRKRISLVLVLLSSMPSSGCDGMKPKKRFSSAVTVINHSGEAVLLLHSLDGGSAGNYCDPNSVYESSEIPDSETRSQEIATKCEHPPDKLPGGMIKSSDGTKELFIFEGDATIVCDDEGCAPASV